MSTSTTRATSERYATHGHDVAGLNLARDGEPIVMRFTVPAGIKALALGGDENEILLQRGLQLHVHRDRRVNGRRVLDVEIGPPAPPEPAAPSVDLSTLDDDELGNLAHQLTTADDFDESRLLAVLDELGRRDGERAPDPSTTAEHQVDDLVARGWDYIDAYAEVHNTDAEQMRQREAATLVDRRKGESFQRAARRAYQQWVALRYIEAETATRGHLLVPASRAKGIDPVSLFSGPAARARKHASDDLKAWWEANGGRVTFAEFVARMTGDRATAQQARMAGQGKDFGV